MKVISLKFFTLSAFVCASSISSLAQTGTVNINQDNRIPELLELKSSMSKDNELADRYKIQLYYGTITEANSVMSRYRNRIGEWDASIEYETPNYKVWVGNFRNRLEADRALLRIHRTFPNAFVFKPER